MFYNQKVLNMKNIQIRCFENAVAIDSDIIEFEQTLPVDKSIRGVFFDNTTATGEIIYHKHLFGQSENAPIGSDTIDFKAFTTYNACVSKELDILKLYGEMCKKDTAVNVDGDDMGDVKDETDTTCQSGIDVSDAALMMS